jgi:hypothetical protein
MTCGMVNRHDLFCQTPGLVTTGQRGVTRVKLSNLVRFGWKR